MRQALITLLLSSLAFAQSERIAGNRTLEGALNFGVESGSGNTYVVTLPSDAPLLGPGYPEGLEVGFKATHGNTSTSTANVQGLGAIMIKKNGNNNIVSGDIAPNTQVTLRYETATSSFQLIQSGFNAGTVGTLPDISGSVPGSSLSSVAAMYLYAHFRDDDTSLYLSYSYDAFSWTTINPFGSYHLGYLRDPTITFQNGTYYFLFTGNAGQVQSFNSTDLKTFSSVVTLTVPGEPGGTLNNWAPEFFKDPVSGNMYVSMAVQNSGGTFSMYLWQWSATTGLATTPSVLTISGTIANKIFDPYLYYKAGKYYIFFADSDNTWPTNPHAQTISYATATTLTGTYTVPSFIQSNRNALGFGTSAEGPTVFDLPNGCTRIVADTFAYLPYSFYTGFSYKPKYTDSCDTFLTFTTSLDENITKAEHGTILTLTTSAQAVTVLDAATRITTNSVPSKFGINQLWPKYTVEAKSNAATGGLQYDEPASFAANPGDDNDAIWSACSGSYGQYCPTPPASNGMWLMNSAANAFGQVHINNPTNAVSGMIFSDQATQFGPSRNGPHNWHIGENYSSGNHNFHIFDDTGSSGTRKSPFWLTSDTGQVLATYGLALGSGTWMDFTKRAGFDSPSTGVVNCGNGTIGDTTCTLNVGTLNATTINGGSVGSSTGYANVAPNANTATTSNIVVIGDSHMAGLGQTTSIPGQFAPTDSYTVTNLAVSGTKACAYWADNGVHEAAVDALYNPRARANILFMEGGGNDAIDNNTGSPAVPWITPQQVYDCQAAYAKRRRALGWKIVLFGMYSRGQVGIGGLTGDQIKNAINGLYNVGAKSWTDAYVNISADPNVGADGAHSNTTYFQGDDIHVVSSYTNTLAFVSSLMIDHAVFGYVQANPVSETIWPGQSNFFLLKNANPSFTEAVGIEYQTSARHYYDGVSAPSNSLPNVRYLYDGTGSHFVYTLKDMLWSWSVNTRIFTTATDPVCTAAGDDGKQWFDISDSSNSHYKVCAKTSGSAAWRTIY